MIMAFQFQFIDFPMDCHICGSTLFKYSEAVSSCSVSEIRVQLIMT
jgi:hypothetical protein